MRPHILLSFLIILLASACSKNPKCWGDHKLKGEIGKSVEIDELACTPTEYYSHVDGIVVRNQRELEDLFNSDCNLPIIDFNKHTLIGKLVTGGCEARFLREIEKSGNDYIYTIKVRECGVCMVAVFSYNWVLIPAVDSDRHVVFEVKR